MKHFTLIIVFLFITQGLFANPKWGPTGHRTLTQIADNHLKRKVKRKIAKLLEGKSLAYVSTYADEIKSDKRYRKFSAWHYVNFPFNVKYQDSKKSKYGDLAVGITTCIAKIKDETASKEDKTFYLKLLVHLIGDLHQPLHVGHAEDRGGNDIQVQWHNRGTNLHHVWDEDMINTWDMSYTEFSKDLDHFNKKEIKQIQSGTVVDWINETQKLAQQVYQSAKKGDKLSWRYSYENLPLLKRQLQKGGLRLAKILNDLFS